MIKFKLHKTSKHLTFSRNENYKYYITLQKIIRH